MKKYLVSSSCLSKSNSVLFSYSILTEIDDTTRRLLIYTHQQTFSSLTEEDIHKKFIEQESKKEWLDFKQNVLNDVLDKYSNRRQPSITP